MSTVDNRIVILTFDNGQFEKNADQSIKTLDRLKNGLKLDGASSGFDKVNKASKSFNLNGMSDAIDTVNHRFSALGVAGATVISELTKMAMNFGTKLISGITQPIIKGGWNRALNIENARFQLEGLGVSWKEVEDDINHGVKETAYGFDAAARAAAQLSASGIQLGEEMKYSLRGISGVAAMTNSSYDEIANIFARVAGQGKVMAVDLNSVAARGLNAAATLGKALNKTEAEIREMVRAGEIDFRQFAKAMDDAYGEHAKDANKTFTGSLANVKAALSRIGADVAANQLVNLKNIFNALIPLIDNIRAALKPLIEAFNAIATKASNGLVKFINFLNSKTPVAKKNISEVQGAIDILGKTGFSRFKQLAEGFGVTEAELKEMVDGGRVKLSKFDEVMTAVFGDHIPAAYKTYISHLIEADEETKETSKSIAKSTEEIEEMANRVIAGEFGNGVDIRREKLEALGYSFELVQNKVNELVGCNFRYEVSAEEAAEATKSIAEEAKEAAEQVDWFGTKSKKVKEGALTNLGAALKNIGKAFYGVGKAVIGGFKDTFSKGAFGTDVQRLSNNFKDFTGKLTLTEGAANGLQTVFRGLFTAIKYIIKGFGWLGTGILKVAEGFAFVIRKILEFIGYLNKSFEESGRKARFMEALGGVIRKVGEIIVGFKNKIVEVAKAIAKTEGFQRFKQAMVALWGVIKNTVGRAVDFVIEKMEKFGKYKPKFSWMNGLVDFFGKVFGKIGDFILALINGERPVKNFFQRMAEADNIGGRFLKFLIRVKDGIKNFFKGIELPDFKTILSKFKELVSGGFEKFKNSNFFKTIAKVFKDGLDELKKIDWKKLLDIAWKLVKIVMTIRYVNSLIQLNKNIKFKFIFNLTSAVKALKHRDFAAKFRDLSIGVALLAGSVYILSKLPADDAWRAVGIISLLIGELVGISLFMDMILADGQAFKKFSTSMISLGVGLVLLAAAMKIFSIMKPETLIKGGTAVATVVFMLAAAARLAGKSSFGTFVGMALAVDLLVPALFILGHMNWSTIFKGATAIASVVFTLSFASRVAGRSSFGTFVGMALALDLLVPAIAILGKMKTDKVLKGAGVIAGVAMALGGAARLASKTGTKTLLSLAVVIGAITAALYILGKMDMKNVISSAGAIAGVALAISFAMKTVTKINKGAFAQFIVILASVTAAFAVLSKFDSGEALKQGLGMSAAVIAISAALAILSGISKADWSVIGQFEIILASITAAFVVLEHFNCDSILPQAEGMSAIALAISGALWILSKIDWQKFGFLAGIEALGLFEAFLIAFTATLGIMGEIDEATNGGMTEAIERGGKALAAVGGAIGEFIGAIKGGYMAGQAKYMDEVAENLKGFSDNIEPFLNSCDRIDNEVLGKMALLGEMLSLMSSGNIMDGISRIVSFGKDPYENVGSSLVTFADYMTQFGNKIESSGINVDTLEKSANSAKLIAEFANAIPRSGGLLNAGLFGKKDDLGTFSKKMVTFADCIIKVAKKVSGNFSDQTVEWIDKAKNAGLKVVEFAKAIPNEGGLLAGIVGDNKISDFLPQLEQFATGIVDFGHAVWGKFPDWIVESINRAADAGVALANMGKEIPNGGVSVLGAIIGDNDMGLWSTEIPKFAEGIVTFAEAVEGHFDEQVVTEMERATNAGVALAKMGQFIENGGPSFVSFIVGDNQLGTWSEQLPLFAQGILAFARAVTGNFSSYTVDQMANATDAAVALADLGTKIGENGGGFGILKDFFAGEQTLATWASELPLFGQGIAGFADNIRGKFDSEVASEMYRVKSVALNLADVYKAVKDIVDDTSFLEKFSMIGVGGADGPLTKFAAELGFFGEGMANFEEKIKDVDTAKVASATEDLTPLIDKAVEIAGVDSENFSKFTETLESLGSAFEAYDNKVKDVDFDNIAAAVEGSEPLVKAAKDINAVSYDGFVKFTDTLDTFAASLVSFSSAGINAAVISQNVGVVYDLINMAIQMKVVDPATVSGFGNALAECANTGVKGFESAFSSSTVLESIFNKGKALVKKAIDGAKSITPYNAFHYLGQDIGSGLRAGIQSKNNEVWDAAYRMVKGALDTAKETAESASPSKAMMRLGNYMGEGLAIGMEQMSDRVYAAGEDSANMILNSVASPINQLKKLLDEDIDLNPVITPILDLNNFNSNASALNGMFGNGSLRLSGSYGLAYAGNINAVANAASEYSKNKADGNKDVVDAIKEMREDIGVLGEAIGNMYVKIDGRALVGQIARPMDMALWNRKMKSERGVY